MLVFSASAQAQDLGFYLSHARENSPLIRDFHNQADMSDADSALIRASYKIQVNAVSNDFYAPTTHGFGYDNIITNGGQLSAEVQAVKTFVSNKNLTSQYEAIRIQRQTLGNNQRLVEKDLQKTITAQYIIVYGDLETLRFNRQVMNLYEEEEKILKRLTQANIYRQSDYLTFYVSLQQQAMVVRQSSIQFSNDAGMLNYLAGIVDTNQVELAAPDLQPAQATDLGSSSLYRQYSLDSIRLLNQQLAISYSYKPKLGMYADAGYNSSLMLDAYKNFGASAGLNFIVPIYDGRQRQLKIQKLAIAERTRQEYRQSFIRQYSQQVLQLMKQLKETESLMDDIGHQIKYSNTLVEVNKKLLSTGEVRITDLILAINAYLTAKNLLNQNYVGRMQIINQMNYWQSI